MQPRLRFYVKCHNRLRGKQWQLPRLRRRLQLRREWRPSSFMLLHRWVCFDVYNVECLHKLDVHVFGVHSWQQVFGWCRTTRSVRLQHWVLCTCGHHDIVFRDGSALYELPRRERMRGWIGWRIAVRASRLLVPSRVRISHRSSLCCGLLRHCCRRGELHFINVCRAMQRDAGQQLSDCVNRCNRQRVPGRLLLHWRRCCTCGLRDRGVLLPSGVVFGECDTVRCREFWHISGRSRVFLVLLRGRVYVYQR
jgi:hypothetical protein